MTLLGRNTRVFDEGMPLQDAKKAFPQWFVVVFEPRRTGSNLVSGTVKAVSKTRDGAFRALNYIGLNSKRATVVQLR